VLDAGVQSDRVEHDERWGQALREEIADADIPMTTVLGHASLNVQEVLNLKAGDVIPCDFEGKVTLLADSVPVFRGTFGISRGQQAVKVVERVRRHKPTSIESFTAKKA
jgi:flagellar motor switch protein FliM